MSYQNYGDSHGEIKEILKGIKGYEFIESKLSLKSSQFSIEMKCLEGLTKTTADRTGIQIQRELNVNKNEFSNRNFMKELLIKEDLILKYFEPEDQVVTRSNEICVCSTATSWVLDYSNEHWKKEVKDKIEELKIDLKEEYWSVSQPKNSKKEENGLGIQLPFDDKFEILPSPDTSILNFVS